MAADAAMTRPAGSPARLPALVPKPVALAPGKGAFELTEGTAIGVRGGSEAMRVAEYLGGLLRPATGYPLPVRRTRSTEPGGRLLLAFDPSIRRLGSEGYRLRVDRDGVLVAAAGAAGLFYGVQTLRQLLPAAIDGRERATGPWRVPAVEVEDRPRFAWRGAMLDVARHFFSVDEVRRFVDLLALYKLNRLHLHLTDDQGWRLAIRGWPRLTSVGGRTQVGGGAGGSYTQQQYAALVSYAAARFVTVVPEIDMPGHTNAALASYPALNCDGVAPSLYTGMEVGFSSLCIGKELTYRFVDDVVRDVAALTPGPYIHIGGDEAHSTSPADYATFVRRVRAIVRARGKRLVGWEEAARVPLARGSVVQHWHDPALARRAVAQGARVIMSPATKAYLDMKYAPDTTLGLEWAGTTSVRDAYSWDPVAQAGLAEEDVLGVEAPLWTETTATTADLDFLAFPRLVGHAEIAWSPGSGRGWAEYRRRLAAQGPRLRALGVRFYEAPGIPWG
jgi:hexosaminidase